MQFKFKNTIIKPSLMETIYLKGKLFRDCIGLDVARDADGVPRPLMMAHDWLHQELGILPTERGENLIVTAEMHLYDPEQFHTEVEIPPYLYAQYKYMDANVEKLTEIHNLLN